MIIGITLTRYLSKQFEIPEFFRNARTIFLENMDIFFKKIFV